MPESDFFAVTQFPVTQFQTSSVRASALPHIGLASDYGGPIPATASPDGKTRIPLQALYLVRRQLEAPPEQVRWSRGRISVTGERHSLLGQAASYAGSVPIRQSNFQGLSADPDFRGLSSRSGGVSDAAVQPETQVKPKLRPLAHKLRAALGKQLQALTAQRITNATTLKAATLPSQMTANQTSRAPSPDGLLAVEASSSIAAGLFMNGRPPQCPPFRQTPSTRKRYRARSGAATRMRPPAKTPGCCQVLQPPRW